MHDASLQEMKKNLETYCSDMFENELSILDIGSCRSHVTDSTYKEICPDIWNYTGVDIVLGDNVDIVMPAEYVIPVAGWSQDIILCGQVLEHTSNPFRLLSEATRKLKVGGWAFIVAPQIWRIHRYPIDTFRFNPDGMQAVVEEAGLQIENVYTLKIDDTKIDCWAVARRNYAKSTF